MVSNKKDKTRPKKEKPKAEESESESESDGAESEEEVVESAAARRKRERGRTAFLRLIRRCIVMIPLALVLGRQPFLKKERGSGVNAMKMRPLEVAIAGAVHFAADSPTFIVLLAFSSLVAVLASEGADKRQSLRKALLAFQAKQCQQALRASAHAQRAAPWSSTAS